MTDIFVTGFNDTLMLLHVIAPVGKECQSSQLGETMGITMALYAYQIGLYHIKEEILQPIYL